MAVALDAPYLSAIQAVPGDTPGEKFKWIGQRIKERLSTCASLEEIVEHQQFARPLAPLVQVEAAKILNKADPKNQSNYEAIAEALKSEDSFVVNRALQATRFFDGTNRSITNVEYFSEHLFPYVSLQTRTKIVKTLALCLARKNHALAEEFFDAIAKDYGSQEAVHLLPACRESFAYDKIVERKLKLPPKIVKTFFHKNPDFVVQYLRLSKPVEDKECRQPRWIYVQDYARFLAKLTKKRLPAFVELVEMHEKQPPIMTLSNKGAEAFLKNGKEHFQRKPGLYMKFLPLKMISVKRMESVFSKLLPEKVENFNTDAMLSYLEYYPVDKRADLLLESYQKRYRGDLLENGKNVTTKLMKLLPLEERVKQARLKMESEPNATVHSGNLENSWVCYLTPEEAVPKIKEQISRTSESDKRVVLLGQIIYCCKVNNDHAALLEFLKYYNNRHRNEQPYVLRMMFDWICEYFDLSQTTEEVWTVLFEMIRRARVKKEFSSCERSTISILEQNAHYRLLHDLPMDQTIEMIVEAKIERTSGTWNILEEHPELERKCLDACINLASQLHTSDKPPWTTDKTGIVFDIIESIKQFNHPYNRRKTRVEPMFVKNYPWLLEELEKIVLANEKDSYWLIEQLRTAMYKYERDVYERIWTEKKGEPADIRLGAALVLLKKNPSSIAERWEEYLAQFEHYAIEDNLRRFVRAVKWYQGIPVKFAERCIARVVQEKNVTSLLVLSHLLDGPSFARFVEPFVPKEKTIDIDQEDAKENYSIVHNLPICMNNVDPPVPLELVGRLCEGDYLSKALTTLTNVCKRTSIVNVISFAKDLATKRVSVRKHGIRMIHMVASRKLLYDFLLNQWNTEKHYSIRNVLFSKIFELFEKEPGEDTWVLLKRVIETLSADDADILQTLTTTIRRIPDDYVGIETELLFRTIDRLMDSFKKKTDAETYIVNIFQFMCPSICDLLPEKFVTELLERFLFHPSSSICRNFSSLVVFSYLIPAKDKLDSRLATFTRIFQEKVKNGWDVPHPQKRRFRPINYAVHCFFEQFATVECDTFVDVRLVDGLLQTFLAALKPHMDAESYLLLIFKKDVLTTKTPKELGKKLAERLPEIVEIFTRHFVSFITSILLYFTSFRLYKDYTTEEINLGIMEGLVEAGSVDARLLAVRILTPTISKKYPERYDKLAKLFSEDEHPVVKSIYYHKNNRSSYDTFPFDK